MDENLNRKLIQKLDYRRQNDSYRILTSEKELVDFSSNDYMGLARSDELYEKIKTAFEKFSGKNRNGSTGSRLLTGNIEYYNSVEARMATWLNGEASLIFNSGYDANIGVLSCIPQRGDTIFYDELVHASISDGIRLSNAKAYGFKHNNVEDLEQKLRVGKDQRYIVVESVYSMDGDSAPLKEIAELASIYNAQIILDEAHSTGIYGNFGNGFANESGLENVILARIHTFGKAMGVHGAVVVGSKDLVQYLINFSRPFIYTTAPSLHSVVSMDESVVVLRNKYQELLKPLRDIIEAFKTTAVNFGNAGQINNSPIQSIVLGDNSLAKKMAMQLQSFGYDVRPILPPTVPEGKARIRICLHNFNSKEDVTHLIELITKTYSNWIK